MNAAEAKHTDTLLDQSQVAEVLGCTRSLVSHYERQAIRKLRDGLRHDPYVREYLRERGVRFEGGAA